MRVLAAMAVFSIFLAGCIGGDGVADEPTPGEGGLLDPEAPVTLRFVAENRSVVEDNITFTFGLQDACLPVGCIMYSALGGEQPAFIKTLDITHLLPPGMHALVEAEATWDDPATLGIIGQDNLQWWSPDVWHSSYEVEAFSSGRATLRTISTNHGPAPAELMLIVLEPELEPSVEVNVHVRVTPFDDAVHATHVVGVRLAGGAAPVWVELAPQDTSARLHVRAPDGTPVLSATVSSGDNVSLPAQSPAGEYRFVFFDMAGPARLVVQEAELASPLMRVLDISPEPGPGQPVPAGGTATWTVDLAQTPYWVGVAFDALDGRSTFIQGAEVRVTAPDGTEFLAESFSCQGCLFSLFTFGGDLADDAYTPGPYTFTVSTEVAQGWTMYERVSTYGPPGS